MSLKSSPTSLRYPPPPATEITHFVVLFGKKIVSLKDINFKSLRHGDNFNNDLFQNISPSNILVKVVPCREKIQFLSDIFLGLWRHIFSLVTYFRPTKSINLVCFVASWKGPIRPIFNHGHIWGLIGLWFTIFHPRLELHWACINFATPTQSRSAISPNESKCTYTHTHTNLHAYTTNTNA